MQIGGFSAPQCSPIGRTVNAAKPMVEVHPNGPYFSHDTSMLFSCFLPVPSQIG